MTIQAVRLNHAVLFVADLERSIAFYGAAFGTELVAREPRANAAFLRMPRSGNHHDLGLFGVGEQPPKPRGTMVCTTWRGRSTRSTTSRRRG
jgi:catechol 2,3-dioxygenase-like lactoylglutathione lyase family enzyme